MSKSNNKRFWWLKLDRNFFKRHDILVVESMDNGEKYVLFYMKMLLESIDHEGMLRFNELIPYDEKMLATITNTDIDIVRSAVKVFQSLKMLEVWDDKTIYMTETNKMMGSETASTIRSRKSRQLKQLAIKTSKTLQCNTNATNCNGEKELEQEQELYLEKELEEDIQLNTPPTLPQIQFLFTKLNLKSDPNKFFNHHNSKQWIRNNGEAITLENLEAAAIYWESQEEKFNPNKNNFTNNNGQVYDTSQYEV